MELYKTENETTLKILYKNETENANAYELFVPNCSVPCKLNQLIKLSAPTILDSVDDLNKICEKEENGANKVSGKKALSNHTGRHVTMMFSISSVLMLLYLFLISC